MRHPRIVILEAHGWIARQLRELVAENRWLVREPKKPDTALSLLREGGPAVLLVEVEPADKAAEPFALIADTHYLCPDMPIVAVSDTKLPDADRTAWTAALFDLGARAVLFPPLSKPVLEDVVSGLMAATIRRVTGVEPPKTDAPPSVLDLADEGLHG